MSKRGTGPANQHLIHEYFQPMSSDTPRTVSTSLHIGELTGLRALLALWVLIGHAAGLAELGSTGFGHFLQRGDLAVDVFIILSGFVITLALNKRPTSWSAFMRDRFRRLMPAYFVTLAVAVCLLPYQGVLFQQMGTFDPQTVSEWSRQQSLEVQGLPYHLFLHVTMLHGVVPIAPGQEAIAPALLPVAWSLSLEWQFYVIAPALHRLLFRVKAPLALLVTAAACVGTVIFNRLFHAEFPSDSALPAKFGLFFLGIYSASLISCFSQTGKSEVGRCLMHASPVVWLFTASVPIGLWVFVMGTILNLAGDSARIEARIASSILKHRILMWIGARSYSLYLCHMLVQWLVLGAIIAVLPQAKPILRFALLLPISAACSLITAHFMERFLERRASFGTASEVKMLPSVH